MSAIPSESYDWVISFAVLEHIGEVKAAAEEQMRVLKPGGYLYVLTPFMQLMHHEPHYSDFWRFTTDGLRGLFHGLTDVEIEVWGKSPLNPSSLAMLFRKPVPGETPQTRAMYWIPMGDEWVFEYIRPETLPSMQWEILTLLAEPLDLFTQIQRVQRQYFDQSGINVSFDELIARYREQIVRPYGTMGCMDGISFFQAAPTR